MEKMLTAFFFFMLGVVGAVAVLLTLVRMIVGG
jgi:hypothetical protein